MAIRQVTTNFTGEVGVNPGLRRISTTDTVETITTENYLAPLIQQGYQFLNGDAVLITHGSAGNTTSLFCVQFSGTNTVLVPTSSEVILPVVSGDFAVFDGTTGALIDSGFSPSNAAKAKVVMASSTVTAGNMAVFADTAGTIYDNAAALNTTSLASATPGTVRAITGKVVNTSLTMTTGNLVGARGEVNCASVSGGFLYGAQGKVIANGTLSGSVWNAAVFGQFDLSAATVDGGQCSAIWGDWGATGATATDLTGCRGIAFTNTTSNVLNAQDYRYGNATYLLELAGAGGTLNYYVDAGVSSGSAGNAAEAQKVITIEINGVAAYIPVFTQNT